VCGIMGYVGSQQAVPILMDGLRRLEYRGYDSAGVAVFDGSGLQVRKAEGKLSRLAEILDNGPAQGTVGIGHTRWESRGLPTGFPATRTLTRIPTAAVRSPSSTTESLRTSTR
jgi:glucosamine--fructose-6-phosphate aminotransferase (isomerizing)